MTGKMEPIPLGELVHGHTQYWRLRKAFEWLDGFDAVIIGKRGGGRAEETGMPSRTPFRRLAQSLTRLHYRARGSSLAPTGRRSFGD